MIVNHNFLFLFGFLFYIVFPLVLIEGVGVQSFSMIPQLESNKVLMIIIFSILTLFFWFLGQKYRIRYFNFYRKLESDKTTFTSVWLVFSLSIFIFLYGLSGFGIRTEGYTNVDFKYSGFLSGFAYLFMVLLIFSWKSSSLKIAVGTFYILACILLLLVGSRLYVLSSLLALVVFYSSFSFKRIRLRYLFVLALLLMLLLVIGVVRSGGVEKLSISSMLFVLGAEPFFTWWSVSLFPFDIVEIMLPEIHGLLSLLINVIPSFIFPDKANYIVSQSVLGGYSAPVGASNVIVSSLIFFGLPIWCLLIFICSNFIYFLRRYANEFILARSLYAIVCSFLPFFFFREIYQIQFKLVLTYVLIVPLFLFVVRLFLKCQKKI